MTSAGEKSQPRFRLSASDGGVPIPGSQTLGFDRAILVGRVAEAELNGQPTAIDLVVASDRVSRAHARIIPAEQGASVEDLKSTNGTFVNDQRVVGQAPLRSGDRVRFDVIEFIFEDTRARLAATATKRADAQGTVVRPIETAEVSVDPQDNAGRKGGTVVMKRNRNLPRQWENKGGGTVVLGPGDLAKVNRVLDADALEKKYQEPTLLVVSGAASGQPYGLRSGGDISFWNIGSDPKQHELDIVLNDTSVSGFHAKLVHREKKWKVIDQMSTNGVYVNGQRFNAAYLASKAHVRFGQVECLFLLPPTSGISAIQTELVRRALPWVIGVPVALGCAWLLAKLVFSG